MPRASAEEGAIMVEYGFLIMLIAAVAAAAVTELGGEVLGLFQSAIARFPPQ
jgi:Flp pilus assembly pilin Flp